MNLRIKQPKTGAKPVLAFTVSVLAGLACLPAFGASDGQWKSGSEAYEKVCSRCHLSGVGPELRGRNLSPTYIKAIARTGLRAMPAFTDSALDDATLEQVAALISASSPPAAAPAAAQPAATPPPQKH